jgi:hypothetical protein
MQSPENLSLINSSHIDWVCFLGLQVRQRGTLIDNPLVYDESDMDER